MSFNQEHTIKLQPFSGLEIITHRLQRQPANVYLLHGHSSAFTASLMIGSMIHQPIAVIDGSMRFNSYTLSSIATTLNIPPKRLLQKIHVTRSFTAFQTEAAITTKLPRFLRRIPCPMVIVLGLLDTYYDEQVKPHECEQSVQRIMQTFKELAKNNVHVLIADVEVLDPPPGKRRLFHLIRSAADIVLRLQPNDYSIQLNEERRTQLWDATTKLSRLSSIDKESSGVNFGVR